MQEYLFSTHEVQIQTLQNQGQIDHGDLLQLTAGFRSLMEIAALLLHRFIEKIRNTVYLFK
jgi:hypothetical protein